MTGLRSPLKVMRLERLGAAHQTRLSFMRVLLRRMRRDGWHFDRPVFDIDGSGVGRAVYRAIGPEHTYSLVAFAHDLPDELRSDRVIAEAWDATFALYDGTPDNSDLDRLQEQVPKQEAGRVSDKELVLSRANRSVRLWSHVVERLSQGRQPDPERVEAVGYLMRTTAVYGSGKFGAADHAALKGRELMDGPFRAEMLSVWLIRAFVMDLAENLAEAKGGPLAVRLDPEIRRRFGIGNSTGLGMAPFLVNHPLLLNAWITARETALARVRELPSATRTAQMRFHECFEQARKHISGWQSESPIQKPRIVQLDADCRALACHLSQSPLDGEYPWYRLYRWGEETLSIEGQELLVSLLLEPYGNLVDGLAEEMGADEIAGFPIDGQQRVGDLRERLKRDYPWALEPDYEKEPASARFWYVSETKLEPRLGERYAEHGAERELPLDTGRAAKALAKALEGRQGDAPVAEFLAEHPEHRRAVRRVQICAKAPYAELRANLVGENVLPIDMLRTKLSFFGATRFDPKSDRWVRITMYQNAPFPEDLADLPEDDWIYAEPVGPGTERVA